MTEEISLPGRNTEGKLVARPLSPHIGIYRWPVTMVNSILTRATGIALSMGAILLVAWLVAAASGAGPFAQMQGFLRSPIGLVLLLGWTASLFFHLFAGLRHLAWDIGWGFAKPGLNPLSWALLAATAVATLCVWLAGYLSMRG